MKQKKSLTYALSDSISRKTLPAQTLFAVTSCVLVTPFANSWSFAWTQHTWNPGFLGKKTQTNRIDCRYMSWELNINLLRIVFIKDVLPAKSKSFIDLLRINSICSLRLDHFLPKAQCECVTYIISFHQFPVSPILALPVSDLNQLPQTW